MAASKHHKKFCAFCKSLGKPESIYTSHFVKDKPGPKGKPVCPELLKNECGYCHELGHTPRFCPKLKARDARRKKAARRAKKAATPRSADGKAPTPTSNLFEALAGHAAPVAPKEDFPKLPGSRRAPKPAPKGVWGSSGSTPSIAEVKALLARLEAAEAAKPFAAEAAAAEALATELAAGPQLTSDEQAFIEQQQEQLEEVTAAGEAFFDNAADAEDAVEHLHATEPPRLVRQGAFGAAGLTSAPLPAPVAGIALPPACDLAADFGDKNADGWGSDDE